MNLKNLLPQNRCFVRGFRHFSAHLTKCHARHGICTLSPLHAALTMRFAKARNMTSLKCCACHAKWRWRSPKCCACHENCNSSSESDAKVLRLPHKTIFDTVWNTLECHKVPRLPHETRLRDVWNFQKWPLCHRHGHRDLTRTVADGCDLKRNVERTHPQPPDPRVKREPLLRIREKGQRVSQKCRIYQQSWEQLSNNFGANKRQSPLFSEIGMVKVPQIGSRCHFFQVNADSSGKTWRDITNQDGELIKIKTDFLKDWVPPDHPFIG